MIDGAPSTPPPTIDGAPHWKQFPPSVADARSSIANGDERCCPSIANGAGEADFQGNNVELDA